MKKSVADKWVKALRSGKYKQGRFALRNGQNEFCCLGVLCDISKLSQWDKNANYSNYLYDKFELDLLPPLVRGWAGMKTHEGVLGDLFCGRDRLTGLNDAGVPFEQIADFIEKNWKDL